MSVPNAALSGQSESPVVSMVTPLFDAVWSDEACTTILTLTEDVDLDTPDQLRDAAAQAAAFAERLMVLADERETAARRLDQQLAALATGQPQLVALFAEVVRDAVGTARNPWAALDRVIELVQGEQAAVTA